MRKPLCGYLKYASKPARRDLELALLRRMLDKLESLSEGSEAEGDLREMYGLLLLLELSSGASTKEDKSSVDWARLLPLLLAVGVVLGVVVAQLLGLDMRRAF